MMSTESLKTLDVSSIDRAPTHEELSGQVIWEDILNSALVRLDLLKRVRKLGAEIPQVQDFLLAIGRREKVDFESFKDLMASIGIEIVLLEDLIMQKSGGAETQPSHEAVVAETLSEQPVQPHSDPLGFSRKTPEFSVPAVEEKSVSQEPQTAHSELPEQTPARVVEDVKIPEVPEPTIEGTEVTADDIRAMVEASYAYLSPEDQKKVYEAAIKELGL